MSETYKVWPVRVNADCEGKTSKIVAHFTSEAEAKAFCKSDECHRADEYGQDGWVCRPIEVRPAPVAPDVPKDAEARAISAFNLKAADLCMPFRIRDDDGRQAMRAALAAYAPVAPGGVITEEQAERVARMFCNAAIGVRAWSKFSDNERRDAVMEMRAALSEVLSPDGKVGGGRE